MTKTLASITATMATAMMWMVEIMEMESTVEVRVVVEVIVAAGVVANLNDVPGMEMSTSI